MTKEIIVTQRCNGTAFHLDRPLNGKRTLHELIAAVASRMQTDPETVRPAYLTTVHKLMQAGFLCSVSDLGKSTL